MSSFNVADAIHQYRSLRSADFSDNQLTKICNKTFLSTRHLKTLDLSKNNISEIEAKAFQSKISSFFNFITVENVFPFYDNM